MLDLLGLQLSKFYRSQRLKQALKVILGLIIAVLKKVRYALCPMPYALCPMPYAHEYLIFLRKAIYVWGQS